MVLGSLAYSGGRSHGTDDPAATLLMLFGGLAALTVGGVTKYYGRQLSAKTMAETLSDDGGPTILYLRSFAGDESNTLFLGTISGIATIGGSTPSSHEECLAAVFKDYGRLIAIGKPGEALPALGAAREYVSNDQWQAEVSRLMGAAALVVIHLGRTEGVWWELQAALRSLPARRLLVKLPPSGWLRRRTRSAAYARLGETVKDGCGKELPADAPKSDYLYLDELRRPHLLARQRGVDETSALHKTLRPVLEALNPTVYATQEKPRSALRRLVEAVFSHRLVLGIVAVLAGMAIAFLGSHSPTSHVSPPDSDQTDIPITTSGE